MKITKTETGSEPIEVSEVKSYLQISDTSEDSVINRLIVQSRKWVENTCGISIMSKQLVLEDFGICFPYMLPYGPVKNVSVLEIDETDYIADTNVFRSGYIYRPEDLSEGQDYSLNVSYTTGYSYVPEDLKYLIMDVFKLFFDGRGSNIQPSMSMQQSLHNYNRNLFI